MVISYNGSRSLKETATIPYMQTPQEFLTELGLASPSTTEAFYPRVRDREDIAVLRDTSSGIIFLSRMDHMSLAHYEEVPGGSYWGAKDRQEALALYREDDERRAAQFLHLFKDKKVVDVGCGTGGLLDYVKDSAAEVAGVEPQSYIREELRKEGYTMFKMPADAPMAAYDVATLFHVLEHITTPLETLREVRALLRPGGRVVAEVPHARDVLLQLESFKKFSLWSEHIVLHTRQSLAAFLEAAGFKNIKVEGYQRYPLGNHLGWLLDGTPGGQKKYPAFHSAELEAAYVRKLLDTDQTDTLIATAEV